MMPHDMGRRLARGAAGVNHWLWWSRAVTLGVRVVVLDGSAVFLVRHTYRPGWYLPGGAVDRGESAEKAVARELLEETGIRCLERPTLHHFYRNGGGRSRDHVACYIVRRFERDTAWAPDWEIAEARFFPLADLPPETTPATRSRIEEIVEHRAPSEHW